MTIFRDCLRSSARSDHSGTFGGSAPPWLAPPAVTVDESSWGNDALDEVDPAPLGREGRDQAAGARGDGLAGCASPPTPSEIRTRWADVDERRSSAPAAGVCPPELAISDPTARTWRRLCSADHCRRPSRPVRAVRSSAASGLPASKSERAATTTWPPIPTPGYWPNGANGTPALQSSARRDTFAHPCAPASIARPAPRSASKLSPLHRPDIEGDAHVGISDESPSRQ